MEKPVTDSLEYAEGRLAHYKSLPRYKRPTDGATFGWNEEIAFWEKEVRLLKEKP